MEKSAIEILDLAGKIVKKINYKADNQYFINELPNSIYLLKIGAGTGSKTIKIIKN